MKRVSLRKALASALSIALLATVSLPSSAAQAISEPTAGQSVHYAVSSFSSDRLSIDGWAATVNQGGVITQESDDAFEQDSKDSFWWRFNDDGSIQGQGNADCEDDFGGAYHGLTYAAAELNEFTAQVQTGVGNWHSRSVFSIGVKTPGEYYTGENASDNVITITSNPGNHAFDSDKTLTVEGKALKDGNVSGITVVSDDSGRLNLTIRVRDGFLYIYNDLSGYKFELNEKYVGGYFSFFSPNSYTKLYSVSLDSIDNKGYFTDMLSLSQMQEDGWTAAYSENPQAGIAFTDTAIDAYYKNEYSGIIRNEVGFTWNGNDSYGNWKDPFKKMAALTYAAKPYQYFTMDMDYLVNIPGVPWPIISFGQPSATPEFFYAPVNANSNPSGGDSAMGIFIEQEGMVNFRGKNLVATRSADLGFNREQWHHVTVAVAPGTVNVSIDGVPVAATSLKSDYNGGYISLMIGHCYSRYRNFEIKENFGITCNNYKGVSLGDGQYANDELLVTGGQHYNEITPKRGGYKFLGFYTDSAFAEPVDMAAVVAPGINLYAKWGVYADQDEDGSLTVLDLIRMKKISAGISAGDYAADIDNDNLVATGEDIAGLRRLLLGVPGSYTNSTAADLVNNSQLLPLGRSMLVDGNLEMDYVNTGFTVKGDFEGDIKGIFTTNRVGSLLNITVDGGENQVVEVALSGKTTLASGLEKGVHTIQVTSGTSMLYTEAKDATGVLRLSKLFYTGNPIVSEKEKKLSLLFLGDSITCGQGLGELTEDTTEGLMKASNAYYSYASVLGRKLNADTEVVATCGAKTNLFAWETVSDGKQPVNSVNWITSLNLLGTASYDTASHQPDVIVVNLGTNDPKTGEEWFYSGEGSAVDTLLKRLRIVYPDSKIVWAYGMMNNGSEEYNNHVAVYKSVIEQWAVDNSAPVFFCDMSSVADTAGVKAHPTAAGHANAAGLLYEFMTDNSIVPVVG